MNIDRVPPDRGTPVMIELRVVTMTPGIGGFNVAMYVAVVQKHFDIAVSSYRSWPLIHNHMLVQFSIVVNCFTLLLV